MKKPTGKTLESIKRQYSGKDYTREDKIRVINWYKKAQDSKKKNTRNIDIWDKA
tara:strand:+ start:1269 stop:1430 length:162 start_codon:yes stop_codon:yes gene_type:complete